MAAIRTLYSFITIHSATLPLLLGALHSNSPRAELYSSSIVQLHFSATLAVRHPIDNPHSDVEFCSRIGYRLSILFTLLPRVRHMDILMPPAMVHIVKWWLKEKNIFRYEPSPYDIASTSLHLLPDRCVSVLPQLHSLTLDCITLLPITNLRHVQRLCIHRMMYAKEVSTLTATLSHSRITMLSICIGIGLQMDAVFMAILRALPTLSRLNINQPYMPVKVRYHHPRTRHLNLHTRLSGHFDITLPTPTPPLSLIRTHSQPRLCSTMSRHRRSPSIVRPMAHLQQRSTRTIQSAPTITHDPRRMREMEQGQRQMEGVQL